MLFAKYRILRHINKAPCTYSDVLNHFNPRKSVNIVKRIVDNLIECEMLRKSGADKYRSRLSITGRGEECMSRLFDMYVTRTLAIWGAVTGTIAIASELMR